MNSDLASVIDPKYIPLCYLSAVVGYLLILGLAIAIYKKLKTNFKLSDLWERKVNLIILCSIIFVSAVVNLLAITTDIVAIFVLSQILEILFLVFVLIVLDILFYIQVEKIIAGNIRRKEEKERGISDKDSESEGK